MTILWRVEGANPPSIFWDFYYLPNKLALMGLRPGFSTYHGSRDCEVLTQIFDPGGSNSIARGADDQGSNPDPPSGDPPRPTSLWPVARGTNSSARCSTKRWKVRAIPATSGPATDAR